MSDETEIDDSHELTLVVDDGWDVAECSCGWVGPPCPGKDTAAEFWAEHF